MLVWLLGFLTLTSSTILDPLYWTESNEKFRVQDFHKITVRIGDKMDLVCPQYNDGYDHNGKLYHRIFEVNKESFQNCDTSKGKRLIDCNQPEQEKKYTVLFQDTNPSPYGLEFLPGETYYYISTSTGTKHGMDLSQGGECANRKMKVAISVESDLDYYVSKELINLENHLPIRAESIIIDEEIIEENVVEETSPGSLLMGIGLGACGVLILMLIFVLAYKFHRKRHPGQDKMLYMSPVNVSRVALPCPNGPEVKIGAQHGLVGGGQGGYGGYTTLIPCNLIPNQQEFTKNEMHHNNGNHHHLNHPIMNNYNSQMDQLGQIDHNIQGGYTYQSDHSTNESFVTQDSFTIGRGEVCEV